jgi:thiosulfate/3-mercaptopyruvate sulfurtransferase
MRPCMLPAVLLSSALIVVCPAPAAAQRAGDDSLVVSTAWLASRLSDPRVVVLEVTHGSARTEARIPGARAIAYADIMEHREGLRTELPPVPVLREVFERVGVSDSTRVVVYAHEAPMAARVLFTLAYLGLDRLSFLDGGIARWRSENRPVTRESSAVPRGIITPRPRPELVVDADWLVARLGAPGLSLIDTRTDGEFTGTGNRSGMPSHGHLAGARQLEWESLFRDPGSSLLRDRGELEKMFAERVRPGNEVVTYCWVGYRASATWLVARWLGYDAKLYDGSYQDWAQRKLPVSKPASR